MIDFGTAAVSLDRGSSKINYSKINYSKINYSKINKESAGE